MILIIAMLIGMFIFGLSIYQESIKRSAIKTAQQEALKQEKPKDLETKIALLRNALETEIWIENIGNKVKQSWTRKNNEIARCYVYVRQSRDGTVNEVNITKCETEASETYRKSLILAVKKASPLPFEPSDEVFKSELIFVFSGFVGY